MSILATYAIGDVHGCLSALERLLELVGISGQDQLVMLGDYIDRGPDSAGVIERLIDLSSSLDLVCLKGNHEIMMKAARSDLRERRRWMMCGGGAAYDSYVARFGPALSEDSAGDEEDDFESAAYLGDGLDVVPETHWQFIQACKPFYETKSHVFVHAAIHGDIPLTHQADHTLFWDTFRSNTPLESGKHVICGHTSQKSGKPLQCEHAVCIDTWACGSGWLTCLNVGTGHYHQANQAGETRSGWLEQ